MAASEEEIAQEYIKALSQLLAICLAEMVSEGKKAGAFGDITDDELHCYVAALCIRGGLNTLNEKRPEGKVLDLCHSIMKTAIIDLGETVH